MCLIPLHHRPTVLSHLKARTTFVLSSLLNSKPPATLQPIHHYRIQRHTHNSAVLRILRPRSLAPILLTDILSSSRLLRLARPQQLAKRSRFLSRRTRSNLRRAPHFAHHPIHPIAHTCHQEAAWLCHRANIIHHTTKHRPCRPQLFLQQRNPTCN